MKPETIVKMGKRAFIQSINPYKMQEAGKVAVFGLDTEYVPYEGMPSDLICWQLASGDQSALLTKPLNIKNLYQQSKIQVHQERFSLYVYVCFFSMAEIQFFNLKEWQLSEFKGKYRLSQSYGDGQLMILDLADWFPHQKLEVVAKLWGYKKGRFPIADAVTRIAKGKSTKAELLANPEFREYAINDAVIDQRIYVKMRAYFLKNFNVDILKSMTPANTSAVMFRMNVKEAIGQKAIGLRRMALRCCWGGRMEAPYRGSYPQAYEYDATGHHPNSAIALNELPLETNWRKTTNLDVWLSGISGIGKVYFEFPEDELHPCLPVWDKDALIYPLEGMSYCSVSEVRLAKEMGAKLVLMEGYFYRNGTTLLTEYLRKIQDLRNVSKDKAERELLKLLSNSIIGKFFQKKVGLDLRVVQKYAEEKGIPYEEALKLKGIEFGDGKITVGSCFYPEWYALILGYARATISRQSKLHKAMIISSDSFITADDLGKNFESEGISYRLKGEGDLVAYRTRFYRIGKKVAHHAVHNRLAASRALKVFIPEGFLKYSYNRFMHLKESWRSKGKVAFGSRTHRFMTTSYSFDTKRLLEGTEGWSRPWKNTEEREEFRNGSRN